MQPLGGAGIMGGMPLEDVSVKKADYHWSSSLA